MRVVSKVLSLSLSSVSEIPVVVLTIVVGFLRTVLMIVCPFKLCGKDLTGVVVANFSSFLASGALGEEVEERAVETVAT